MSRRYALSDPQWQRIEDLLPGRPCQPGARARDNRLFVDAVLYRYRAGIPWRDLPARFGVFRVVHTRHSRWSKTGAWSRLLEALAQDADNEYAMIDSTIVLENTLGQTVIAYKAYDAQAQVIEPLLAKGKSVVIPSRAARNFLGAIHMAGAMVWLA